MRIRKRLESQRRCTGVIYVGIVIAALGAFFGALSNKALCFGDSPELRATILTAWKAHREQLKNMHLAADYHAVHFRNEAWSSMANDAGAAEVVEDDVGSSDRSGENAGGDKKQEYDAHVDWIVDFEKVRFRVESDERIIDQDGRFLPMVTLLVCDENQKVRLFYGNERNSEWNNGPLRPEFAEEDGLGFVDLASRPIAFAYRIVTPLRSLQMTDFSEVVLSATEVLNGNNIVVANDGNISTQLDPTQDYAVVQQEVLGRNGRLAYRTKVENEVVSGLWLPIAWEYTMFLTTGEVRAIRRYKVTHIDFNRKLSDGLFQLEIPSNVFVRGKGGLRVYDDQGVPHRAGRTMAVERPVRSRWLLYVNVVVALGVCVFLFFKWRRRR